MNKLMKLSMVAALTLGLVACAKAEETEEKGIKVGMATDSGTIDDKSFNQGTWEGVLEYKEDNPSAEVQYLMPTGETTQDYLEAIDNLAMTGVEVMVLPGFKFEEALGVAQEKHPEIKFVAIDAEPLVGVDDHGNPKYEVADNTISIFFAEQQASFLAGVATALETETNKVAFLGGMEVPAVQKLGWGFVAGIAYANANLGTNVEVTDYIYQGTFTDLDAGKAIAAGMYDKGVDVVFAAAGGVGVGAINEAKTRAEDGNEVFIVGVDVDQYDEGLLTNGSSVILTSAMKYLGQAAYEQINAYANGEFEGGRTILMDVNANGVGLPRVNPNLSDETIKQVNEAAEMIKTGEIEVPNTKDGLISFLEEMDCDFGNLGY